jgi:hypothetical protein
MKKVTWVINFYILLAFFSIPHLIDDFLFDIPLEFGISNRTAQILAGFFILIFMLIFTELVRGTKRGLYGGMFMGSFLALAGILKHMPLIIKPGPYWSGWFSEGLIVGMIISGLSLLISGIIYMRGDPDEQ